MSVSLTIFSYNFHHLLRNKKDRFAAVFFYVILLEINYSLVAL